MPYFFHPQLRILPKSRIYFLVMGASLGDLVWPHRFLIFAYINENPHLWQFLFSYY